MKPLVLACLITLPSSLAAAQGPGPVTLQLFTEAPASCQPPALGQDTDATSGSQLMACEAGTFVAQGGGGTPTSIADGDTTLTADDATPAFTFDLDGVADLFQFTSSGGIDVNGVEFRAGNSGNGSKVLTTGETNVNLDFELAGTGEMRVFDVFGTYNGSSQRNGLHANVSSSTLLDIYRAGVRQIGISADGVGSFAYFGSTAVSATLGINATRAGAASASPLFGILGQRTVANTTGTEAVNIALGKSYPYGATFYPASGSVDYVHVLIDADIWSQGGTGDYTMLRVNAKETNFLGATGLLIDAQVDGSSVFSVDNAGIIVGSPPKGELWEKDVDGTPSSTITVTTAGTYYPWITSALDADCSGSGAPWPCCTGSGTGTCDAAQVLTGVTADSGANATCTALDDPYACCTGSGTGTCGDLLIVTAAGDWSVSISMSYSGTNSSRATCCAFVNDAAPTGGPCFVRKLGTGGDVGSASSTSVIALAAGDEIDLRCTADGNGHTIDIWTAHLVVEM